MGRGPHFMQGWEFLTQEELWKYCQRNPVEQVAYIHSKGSYHASMMEDVWRRFLMRGVASEECQNMTTKCNVCSSRFSPFPHQHVPGNMWLARCSYIRKLANPRLFMHNMSFVHDLAQRPFNPSLMWDGAFLGMGRFAAEHWVGSHPDVEPCDVYDGAYRWGSPTTSEENHYRNSTWVPQLYEGLRFQLRSYVLYVPYGDGGFWITPKTWASWVQWRCNEWHGLYHKLPP